MKTGRVKSNFCRNREKIKFVYTFPHIKGIKPAPGVKLANK